MARFRLKILVGFFATILIFSVLSVYTFFNNKAQLRTTDSVVHTMEVLYASQTLLNDLLDAETGQRGYILTGDPSYLEPYEKSLQSIRSDMEKITELTSDNKLQTENLSKIMPMLDARMKILAAVISERQNGFDAAKAMMIKMGGLQLTSEIRSAIVNVQNIEHNLLEDRRAQSESKMSVFNTTYFLTGTAMICVILVMFYVIYTNMSAREQIQIQLEKTSAEMKDLYENAPCGYFSVDSEARITNINNTLRQWLGYTKDQALHGIQYEELLTPETRAAFNASYAEEFARFKEKGIANDLEFDFERKHGASFPVLVNSTALYDADGKFVRSRSSVFDNTERKRAELERDNFFNNSLDLLAILSPDLDFYRWNSMWLSKLGYHDSELQHKNVKDFIHPEDLDHTIQLLSGELSSGRTVITIENRFIAKDGHYHWLQWNAVPLLNKGIAYAFARDITEQKIATDKVKQLNHELEAFTYSVSHDLRSPLRSITGFAQILKEDYSDRIDAEGVRLTEVIMKSSRRMGQLIDDLLDFSRLGRKELSMSKLNMKEMVEDIVQEQKQYENGRAMNVLVHPLKSSKADVNMLRVVWTNLISNAFKYSRKKDMTEVEIGSYDVEDKVCYYIYDKGAGFDMRYVNKLFGVFQRLHKSNEFEGTGVGLALVKRIIDRHGGSIWAESKVNEGSKFFFTLPMYK